MKKERDQEIKGRNVITVLSKRAIIIAALLIVVVAGAVGLWLMRSTARGNLAGPVPTPDLDVAPSPTGDGAKRAGDLLTTIPLEKLENARLKIEAADALKLNPEQLTASQNRSAPAAKPAGQRLLGEPAKAKPSQPVQSSQDQTQSVTVTLDARGYHPESFSLQQGIPARVTFVRKVEGSCGDEIVLADYNIKRELPLNQPVVVEFTPAKTGEFKFACGMDMIRGKIIVQ
jgi:cupredoxin-like protein